MKLGWFFILAFSSMGSECYAHTDISLAIAPNGDVSGLPDEYGTFNLIVDFSQSNDASIQSIVLARGASKAVLPSCITGLVQSSDMDDVELSASWYHDETTLPYYMNLSLYDPNLDPSETQYPGYTLLFNLRTGKLMSMTLTRVVSKTVTQDVPVDVGARCTPEQLRGFMDDVAI